MLLSMQASDLLTDIDKLAVEAHSCIFSCTNLHTVTNPMLLSLQALDLLTDVDKLAQQAQRFISNKGRRNSVSTRPTNMPKSPSSSHTGLSWQPMA